MSAQRHQRIAELFNCVCRLDPEERPAFLEMKCGGDLDLRREVQALLDKDPGAEPTVQTPVPAGTGFFAGPDIPDRIGPYRVFREIGRGGMGSVLLAVRDDDQIKKRVAIKLIRRGMDTADILRRFDLERQVLTALSHPNIARVMDAGATPEGLPYFVMEYIEGEPIDRFCDAQELSIVERLGLFAKVCSAVHYAHQNLIVHRDLKPGNILVGADGEPKLLDFGIAKMLNPELSAFSIMTGPEIRLMTPEYASPEQVAGKPVSTSSDVYSLGVLLYELLTGHAPYQFKSRLHEEIIRVICEVEPERPSTRVTKAETVSRGDGTTRLIDPRLVAKTRHGQPHKLKRRLAGDIDNIVLMALRKVPRRRYSSVEQFAQDIQRHLTGLPVIARPDQWSYRAAKFLQRNRAGVATAAAVFLLLLAGIVVTGIAWREASRQATIARQASVVAVAAQKAAEQQRDRADNERRRAGMLARKLLEVVPDLSKLAGALPSREQLAASTVEYLREAEADSKGDPQLRRELAAAYSNLAALQGGVRSGGKGDPAAAAESIRKSIDLLRTLAQGPGDPAISLDLAAANIRLADALEIAGESPAALAAANEALSILEPISRSDGAVATRRLLATAYNKLADLELHSDSSAALRHYTIAYQTREDLLKADPANADLLRDISVACAKRGKWAFSQQQFEEAKAQYDAALRHRLELVRLAPDSARAKRDLLKARQEIAGVLLATEDLDGAEQHLRAAYTTARELAEGDPSDLRAVLDLAQTQCALGDLAIRRDDIEEARRQYTSYLTAASELKQASPENTQYQFEWAKARESLGTVLVRVPDPDAALVCFNDALAVYESLAKKSPKNFEPFVEQVRGEIAKTAPFASHK